LIQNRLEQDQSQSELNLIQGKNSIQEAIDKEIPISKIWVLDKASRANKFISLEKSAKQLRIPVLQVPRSELVKISGEEEPRSIIARVSPVKLLDEEFLFDEKKAIKKLLVPINVEDPYNLGAIIRSAYAFGIDALLLSNRKSAQISSTVIEASSGAVYSLPIVRINNVVSILEKLKKKRFWVYAASLDERSEDLNKIEFDEYSVILLGNEAKGLSENLLKHSDFHIRIPIKFESLNVSVAAGIILNRLFSQNN
jgi:23S rRNA (guanosine2251-2'-O)-methyltransferase